MRSNKIVLAMGLLILGITATGSALAQRQAYRHGGGYHGGGYYGGHGGSYGHGHSHFSFGLGIGWPWGWGYPYGGYYPYYGGYYPYYGGGYAPSYYAPYPYYGEGPVAGEAPEYIERGDGGAPSGASPNAPPYAERSEPAPQPRRRAEGTWHFCPESNGYYPYVQQCPSGWQRVPARPPADSGAVR